MVLCRSEKMSITSLYGHVVVMDARGVANDDNRNATDLQSSIVAMMDDKLYYPL
jgi:hypothetical protein